MKKWILMVVIAGMITGCRGRELEDCLFPTVLTVKKETMEQEQKRKQETTEKYRQFGQVKAVIFSNEATVDVDLFRENLLYLEKNPMFARNLLLFVGTPEVLEEVEKKEEETGIYLEDLYKNQPENSKILRVALKEALNQLHNGEETLELPQLKKKEGKLLIDGNVTIHQERMEETLSPVTRKTHE